MGRRKMVVVNSDETKAAAEAADTLTRELIALLVRAKYRIAYHNRDKTHYEDCYKAHEDCRLVRDIKIALGEPR